LQQGSVKIYFLHKISFSAAIFSLGEMIDEDKKNTPLYQFLPKKEMILRACAGGIK
jgi:hypothetical protein